MSWESVTSCLGVWPQHGAGAGCSRPSPKAEGEGVRDDGGDLADGRHSALGWHRRVGREGRTLHLNGWMEGAVVRWSVDASTNTK